jgi:hypothetical protein
MRLNKWWVDKIVEERDRGGWEGGGGEREIGEGGRWVGKAGG